MTQSHSLYFHQKWTIPIFVIDRQNEANLGGNQLHSDHHSANHFQNEKHRKGMIALSKRLRPQYLWHSCCTIKQIGQRTCAPEASLSQKTHLRFSRASSRANHRHDRCEPSPPNQQNSLRHQLEQLRTLIVELSLTNSKLEKVKILRNYPDLAQLLHFILHRHTRLHIKSEVLKRRIANREKSQVNEVELKSSQKSLERDDQFASVDEKRDKTNSDLLTIFDILKRREITGYAALDFLITYLDKNAIIQKGNFQNHEKHSLSLLDVFMRCLDRNLKVGVSESILRIAFPPESTREANRIRTPSIDDIGNLPHFNVALGKSLDASELEETINEGLKTTESQCAWYVSRKLDGVRCVLQIDLHCIKQDGKMTSQHDFRFDPIKITALSRTGRPFHTLDVLTEKLKSTVAELPVIRDMLNTSLQYSRPIGPDISAALDIARIYLDGEVCILTPEAFFPSDQVPNTEVNDVLYVEDFQAIVGQIKRKNFTIENPAYFPFDILSYDEFHNWKDEKSFHDPFCHRVEKLKKFVQECSERGLGDSIRSLEQERIVCLSDVQKWRTKAAERGWEGLIIRKGGAYEGRRTTSIRKIKDWQEDEYTVEAIETATMRLPIGQKYAERLAMASAVIRHKGIPVHVGSGFSVSQRIAFAEKPELIIGKTITVVYFEESRSLNRVDQNQFSLRFPRVKFVWDTEGRTI